MYNKSIYCVWLYWRKADKSRLIKINKRYEKLLSNYIFSYLFISFHSNVVKNFVITEDNHHEPIDYLFSDSRLLPYIYPM